jgi:hypothetical protein
LAKIIRALRSYHPLRIHRPSGLTAVTSVLVNVMVQPRSANGPRPIRVLGKEGITWPCVAEGGRDGTKASVALATDFSGRPFATLMPMVGACGLRLDTGALGTK